MMPGYRNRRENELSTQRKEKARRFQRGPFLFGAALFATFSRAAREKVESFPRFNKIVARMEL
jgi:hypothetical protein